MMSTSSRAGREDGFLADFGGQLLLGAWPGVALVGLIWGSFVGPRWLAIASIVALVAYGVFAAVALLWTATMIPIEIFRDWGGRSTAGKIVLGTIAIIIVIALIAIVAIVIALMVI